MSAPTPADVHGAVVVRLCSRTRVWTSPPMTPQEAEQLADQLGVDLQALGDSARLLRPFLCGDGRRAAVRARIVESIELGHATVAPLTGWAGTGETPAEATS